MSLNKIPQRSHRVRMTSLGITIMCDKKNIYWQTTAFLIKWSANFSIQIINMLIIPHNLLQDTEHPSLYIQKHSFLFRLSELCRGILLLMKFCKSAVLLNQLVVRAVLNCKVLIVYRIHSAIKICVLRCITILFIRCQRRICE